MSAITLELSKPRDTSPESLFDAGAEVVCCVPLILKCRQCGSKWKPKFDKGDTGLSYMGGEKPFWVCRKYSCNLNVAEDY